MGWKASPRGGVTLQTEVLTEEDRRGMVWAQESEGVGRGGTFVWLLRKGGSKDKVGFPKESQIAFGVCPPFAFFN